MSRGKIPGPTDDIPAGYKTGSCEYAYAFLSSTALSGNNRYVPAGTCERGLREKCRACV
jgi:hypothetical protein